MQLRSNCTPDGVMDTKSPFGLPKQLQQVLGPGSFIDWFLHELQRVEGIQIWGGWTPLQLLRLVEAAAPPPVLPSGMAAGHANTADLGLSIVDYSALMRAAGAAALKPLKKGPDLSHPLQVGACRQTPYSTAAASTTTTTRQFHAPDNGAVCLSPLLTS
jgi:hypothetical protein